jgi:hypothetical protein
MYHSAGEDDDTEDFQFHLNWWTTPTKLDEVATIELGGAGRGTTG